MSGSLFRIQEWEKLAKESKYQPGLMAANCTIGLRQLERFFAQNFERSPKVWAKELQMSLALRLISQGWKNTAVVEELGFANESHFCHEFRKFYGASPRAFAPLYGGRAVKGTGITVDGRSSGVPRANVAFRQLSRVASAAFQRTTQELNFRLTKKMIQV